MTLSNSMYTFLQPSPGTTACGCCLPSYPFKKTTHSSVQINAAAYTHSSTPLHTHTLAHTHLQLIEQILLKFLNYCFIYKQQDTEKNPTEIFQLSI